MQSCAQGHWSRKPQCGPLQVSTCACSPHAALCSGAQVVAAQTHAVCKTALCAKAQVQAASMQPYSWLPLKTADCHTGPRQPQAPAVVVGWLGCGVAAPHPSALSQLSSPLPRAFRAPRYQHTEGGVPTRCEVWVSLGNVAWGSSFHHSTDAQQLNPRSQYWSVTLYRCLPGRNKLCRRKTAVGRTFLIVCPTLRGFQKFRAGGCPTPPPPVGWGSLGVGGLAPKVPAEKVCPFLPLGDWVGGSQQPPPLGV